MPFAIHVASFCKTTTWAPLSAAVYAALHPETPAPTTTMSASIVSAISVMGSGGVRQSPSACPWPIPLGFGRRRLRGAARKPSDCPHSNKPGSRQETAPRKILFHDSLLFVAVIWWPSATSTCTLPAERFRRIYRKPVFLAVAAYRLIQTIGCPPARSHEKPTMQNSNEAIRKNSRSGQAQTPHANPKSAMAQQRFFATCKQSH